MNDQRSSQTDPMDGCDARMSAVPRPRTLRAGLLLILIGSYLFFLPFALWPFLEPKLLLLNLGAILVWWSGLPLTRRPGLSAGIFAGVLVLAALTGVAPLDSLLGVRFASTGLALLLPCLFLVAAVPALPEDVLERVPAWLTGLGAVVSAVMLVALLLPGLLRVWPALHWDLTRNALGSTVGHPLFAIALLAVALAAALDRHVRRRRVSALVMLGVVALGLALPHEASSFVLAAVVVACWLWRARPERAVALQGIGVVVLAFVLSFVVVALPNSTGTGATDTAQVGDVAQAQFTPALQTPVQRAPSPASSRLAAWRVGLRAWADRPLLGWGTDMGLTAYLANVTPQEAARQAPERAWWDVHNIFIQFLLTTGVVGLLALLFLIVQTMPWALTAPPDLAWASAGVVALGFWSLYEPINVAVLPVLAVVLGAASRPRGLSRREPNPRILRGAVGVVLAACTVLIALALVQGVVFLSSVKRESVPGLRAAAAMVPWRTESKWYIARFGDPAAGNTMMADLVRSRPWDPEVRLSAAWVAELSGRRDLAERYLMEQLEVFPGDGLGVEEVLQGNWPP